MKKLFSLTFALLSLGFQASVSAQSLPGNPTNPDILVKNFCREIENSDIKNEKEIAELLSTYLAELDNPNVEQIVALSQIAVKLKTGQGIDSACN